MEQEQTPQQVEQQQTPQQRLNAAAQAGDISLLYGCIQDFPHILDGIDKIPYVDTPLHIAASAGHAYFALEIMRLMPSYSKKLNPQGLSPLDLALRNGHSDTVSRLINFDKELIRVKGRESFTPLHYVAETKGVVDLLAEFLCACPESIMDRTIRGETAVHIALKNSNLKAFEVLLRWLDTVGKQHVLNWKNDEGNTVLHIAVSTSQPQIVKLAVKYNMDKNAKNLMGLTAFDMAEKLNPSEARTEIENILSGANVSESSPDVNDCSRAEFFMSPLQFKEIIVGIRRIFIQQNRMTMEVRNVTLVVAVLIATATFQAILSPPGGVVSSHNNQLNKNGTYINATMFNTTIIEDPAGQVLFKNSRGGNITDVTYGTFFNDFYQLNTVCFVTSIMMIILVFPFQLSTMPLHFSLIFLMRSYGEAFYVISPSYSSARGYRKISNSFALVVYGVMVVNYFIVNMRKIRRCCFLSRLQRKRFRMHHSLFDQ